MILIDVDILLMILLEVGILLMILYITLQALVEVRSLQLRANVSARLHVHVA